MHAQPNVGELLAAAHKTAAEVRTLGDYERAQMIVMLEASIATQAFGYDLMALRMADYFCEEVWRLARH